MPTPSRFLLCAALAGVLTGRAAEEAPLPKESPFMPTAGGAVTVGASEAWEFAAVQTVEKKTSVYIYDRPSKKGRWIAVGDTADGIAVKSYDAARDLVAVRVGGVDKTLALRKASASNGAATPAPAAATAAAWNVPPPATAPAAAPVAPPTDTPAALPTVPQPPPPAPGTIAHQEQEARMLVSDLLEIGMVQRKAYEEAQKKAAAEKASRPVAATPPR